MTKITIGLLFIVIGVLYGSLAQDKVYNATLGWLLKNDWIKPPQTPLGKSLMGAKATIYFFASILVLLGLFIIIKGR